MAACFILRDDSGKIAILEERTVGSDSAPATLQRYIYSNHLSTASLELDENAAIISYEEYHPYGTTSYQAMNATINAVAKRYRYTGKERDEETGLYYHGARYYIPWLCRWTAVDPMESKYAGQSPYNYGFCNPVMWNDPDGMDPATASTSTATASTTSSTSASGTSENTKAGFAKSWTTNDGKVLQHVSEEELAKAQETNPNVLAIYKVVGYANTAPESETAASAEPAAKPTTQSPAKAGAGKAPTKPASTGGGSHKGKPTGGGTQKIPQARPTSGHASSHGSKPSSTPSSRPPSNAPTPATAHKPPARKQEEESFWETGLNYLEKAAEVLTPYGDLKDIYNGIKEGDYKKAGLGLLSLTADVATGGATRYAKAGIRLLKQAPEIKKAGSALVAFVKKDQSHHLIPKQIHKEYKDVFKAMGLKSDHEKNLMKLATPFHGNHPKYNDYVRKRVAEIFDKNGNPFEELVNLQKEMREMIKKAQKSGLSLNDYFKRFN